jgi:hypothetical protein
MRRRFRRGRKGWRAGRAPVEPIANDERLASCADFWATRLSLLRDRVAGCLVLIYAQPLTRVLALSVDDVTVDGDPVWIQLGREPVELPDPLARMIAAVAWHLAGACVDRNRRSSNLMAVQGIEGRGAAESRSRRETAEAAQCQALGRPHRRDPHARCGTPVNIPRRDARDLRDQGEQRVPPRWWWMGPLRSTCRSTGVRPTGHQERCHKSGSAVKKAR